jgi:hypothetical protein
VPPFADEYGADGEGSHDPWGVIPAALQRDRSVVDGVSAPGSVVAGRASRGRGRRYMPYQRSVHVVTDRSSRWMGGRYMAYPWSVHVVTDRSSRGMGGPYMRYPWSVPAVTERSSDGWTVGTCRIRGPYPLLPAARRVGRARGTCCTRGRTGCYRSRLPLEGRAVHAVSTPDRRDPSPPDRVSPRRASPTAPVTSRVRCSPATRGRPAPGRGSPWGSLAPGRAPAGVRSPAARRPSRAGQEALEGVDARFGHRRVGHDRLELSANGLRVRCSTN